MRIKKLKGSDVALWSVGDVDMTADLDTLMRVEVDRWHGDGNGEFLPPVAESDEIPTMVRHGHVGAALHYLIGATELPVWEAIAGALWFNGRRDIGAIIAADWEAWCALGVPAIVCPACDERLYEVDPHSYRCHCCDYRSEVNHAHTCRECGDTIEHATTDDVCGFDGLCADCEWLMLD